MKIAQISKYKLPQKGYGGTSRVIDWLSKALIKLGHTVYLISRKGTNIPGVELILTPKNVSDFTPFIPEDTDIVHFHDTNTVFPDKPFIITMHGNDSNAKFLPNTVFVSKNHASRHKLDRYVYNGIDPSEFIFQEEKDDYFLFLSKVSRRIKGIRTAIELAKIHGFNLIVAGGRRLNFSSNITYVGEVEGIKKAKLLAGAKALIFPIIWNEPFGLVVPEALISGTPVITTNRGSMPELVPNDVGYRCDNFEEFEAAINNVHTISNYRCREWAMDNFSSDVMAKSYIDEYIKIINSKTT